MLVSDLAKRARALADDIRDPNFNEYALIQRRALESEQERRVRVARMLSEGASLRRGDERILLPCGFCLNPQDPELERQEQSEDGWPKVCAECRLLPITAQERKRLLAAYEEWQRQIPLPTYTDRTEYGRGRWRCQHGKTWYDRAPDGLDGGYPVRAPSRLGESQSGWVLSCGLRKGDCGEEHHRRQQAEYIESHPGGVVYQGFGLTAGSQGGTISMPFNDAYPMGVPSQRSPR